VALKRSGVWHNQLRNRKIARLAQEFLTQPEAFARLLPGTPAAPPDLCSDNVVVVVENIEHASALSAKLPEFYIGHGPGLATEGLTPQLVQLLKLPSPFSVSPQGIIATTSAAFMDFDLRATNVIIRADAGCDHFFINASRLVEPDTEPAKPLLLIDFHDKHHPALRQQSRLRWQAYRQHGWFAPGADSEQARVDQFLATRPKRPIP
jgi:hypothetical protein